MNKIHESFLKPFFNRMNEEHYDQWCVLHSYETLPYFSESDVDMAFSGDTISLETLIIKVADTQGWTIYQKFWYDSQQCFYYVLKNDKDNTLLALDFLIDNKGIGRYGFKTSLLTNNCDTFNDFIPIPNAGVAFSYKFVKRLVKKIPIIKDNEYLLVHFQTANQKKIEEIMISQFGSAGNDLLQKHFKDKIFLLDYLEMDFLLKAKRSKFKRSMRYFLKLYWESRRILNRIFLPSGIIIYIPKLSEDELDIYTEKLEKELGILFRFVKHNKANSLFFSIKGLVGSTLVICQNSDEKHIKIKKHWLMPNIKKIDIQESKNLDIEKLVDLSYGGIMKALLERNRFGKGKECQ